MRPEALREAHEWLVRADTDLRLGERALEAPPIASGAAYHAQQAAEKALKAFLAAHDLPFRRTHDFVELLTQCVALDPVLSQFDATARTLAPYATEFRYPGGTLEPPLRVAETAVKEASELVRVVRERFRLRP